MRRTASSTVLRLSPFHPDDSNHDHKPRHRHPGQQRRWDIADTINSAKLAFACSLSLVTTGGVRHESQISHHLATGRKAHHHTGNHARYLPGSSSCHGPPPFWLLPSTTSPSPFPPVRKWLTSSSNLCFVCEFCLNRQQKEEYMTNKALC